MRTLWGWIFLCGAGNFAFGATTLYRGDFYAEQSYQSRLQQSATSLRQRNEFLQVGRISAYATIGAELQNFDQAKFSGPADSYLYATPGIKSAWGNLSLFVEPRLRYYPDPKSQDRTIDLRTLVVYGTQIEGPAWGSFVAFGEFYGESLLTSADRWNLIGNAFVRAGIRYKLAAQTFADLFVEPFLALDTVRHYYNNRSDIKLTFRLQGNFSGLQLGLQTSFVKNTYFSRGNFEPNPFQQNNVGIRVLGVVGGLW